MKYIFLLDVSVLQILVIKNIFFASFKSEKKYNFSFQLLGPKKFKGGVKECHLEKIRKDEPRKQ